MSAFENLWADPDLTVRRDPASGSVGIVARFGAVLEREEAFRLGLLLAAPYGADFVIALYRLEHEDAEPWARAVAKNLRANASLAMTAAFVAQSSGHKKGSVAGEDEREDFLRAAADAFASRHDLAWLDRDGLAERLVEFLESPAGGSDAG